MNAQLPLFEHTDTRTLRSAGTSGAELQVSRLLENFDTVVDASGSMKRLRSMILKLGLSGRLGTNRPSENPATTVSMGDGSNESAPHANWVVCRLPDVAEIEMGNSPPGSSYNERGEGVPLINGPVEFSPGPFGRTRRTKFTTSPARMCRKGDLLVCVRGATTGRTNVADFDACIGRGVALVRAFHNQEYLNYFMWLVGNDLLEAGSGTTFPAISRDDLEALTVLLPPRAEQKRIVAKVDQLMALCDELEARQTKKRKTGARLTKSVLEAVTTADESVEFDAAWKRAVENFDVLIDRAEKVGELRAAILSLAAVGRLVTPTAGPTPTVPTGDSYEPEFQIPSTWAWSPLGRLCRFIDYRGRTPTKTPHGIRLITAKNVRMGVLRTEPEEFIAAANYDGWMTRGLPRRGDVLFTTEAPLGNVAQLMTDERVALAQRIITLRPDEVASSAFLKTILMSPLMQAVIRRHATGTTAMGIKAAKLKLVPFPVPPLDEQLRIVERVEQLMKVCDELEAKLLRAEDSAAKLVEAVVQELVV